MIEYSIVHMVYIQYSRPISTGTLLVNSTGGGFCEPGPWPIGHVCDPHACFGTIFTPDALRCLGPASEVHRRCPSNDLCHTNPYFLTTRTRIDRLSPILSLFFGRYNVTYSTSEGVISIPCHLRFSYSTYASRSIQLRGPFWARPSHPEQSQTVI